MNDVRITEQVVLKALAGVKDPDLGRDLVDLGMIKNIRVNGSDVALSVELTTPACPLKGKIESDVRTALKQNLPQLTSIEIEMTAQVRGQGMTGQVQIPVKNVFAVGSGKGGVGKSTVAASIAYGLQSYGASVGLMDADVYGPSIPHMLGVNQRPMTRGNRIEPVEVDGLKVMSMGFLVPPEEAVVWRGPMLHGAVTQFLRDVEWGDLDYLVIDLPPGTGDVVLTLSQIIPLVGGVIVCTPQDVALLDAIKALNMFKKVKIAPLGIVENMSHFDCPKCGHRSEIFGHGGAHRKADELGVPFLGEIPINLQMRINGDEGKLKDNLAADSPSRPYLLEVCEQLAAQISIQNMKAQRLPTLEIIG
jgi:ATP-binding protein involved in chromosome partitioning